MQRCKNSAGDFERLEWRRGRLSVPFSNLTRVALECLRAQRFAQLDEGGELVLID